MSYMPNTLNSFWLWREVSSKIGVSNPAYKYWKNTPNMKLNNKYVFIQKETLPEKYEYVEPILTDLSGHLPIKYASDRLHVNEHIFSYEKMKLYKEFENGIKVGKNSIVQLGKMKDLDLSGSSAFYNLKNDYGIVVYE